MSSPLSSPFHLSPRVARKVVPEGSDDFQKVLDGFLHADELGEVNNKRNEVLNGDDYDTSCSDEDGFDDINQFIDDNDEDIIGDHTGSVDTDKVNNNNTSGHSNPQYSCKVRQCQRREAALISPRYHPRSVNPDEVTILDLECNGSTLGTQAHHCKKCSYDSEFSSSLKLPGIISGENTMGTTCSSSFYDKREWHSVHGDNKKDDRGRKQGRLPGKRNDPIKCPPKAIGKGTDSITCTCSHSNPEIFNRSPTSGRATSPRPISLSDSKISRTPSPQNGSHKEGDKKGNGMSHNKSCSRINNSKKLSSSSKVDVSPHRLLVRRSYSPQSRINNHGGAARRNTNYSNDAYRQRSQSWSESKTLSTPAPRFKSISPPTFRVQSPEPSLSSQTSTSSTALTSKSKDSSTSSRASLSPSPTPLDCADSSQNHKHWCPMFTSLDKDKLSVGYDGASDEDITPISRRRAVSESHTSKAARLRAQRKNGPDDPNHCDEHPHVHWADEERGSSLSTSVFLTSIRPRSFSHGAVGSGPQRPILKKVTGL